MQSDTNPQAHTGNNNPMIKLLRFFQGILNLTRSIDFVGPLALRLYLAPIFWMAGTNKLNHFDSTVEWFGNAEWGLGLPFPLILTALVVATELGGSISLLVGFAVRWISIPLMITMAVAALTVHWENGWLAIADNTGVFATERTAQAAERLERGNSILQTHGNFDWLTEAGEFVVLNNGIEFATTYFIMLLILFFIGAGRFFSMDYWVHRYIN